MNKGIALVGARIYRTPFSKPINKATVIIERGIITKALDSHKITIPEQVKCIDCSGLIIVASFQNSHVHFTEDFQKLSRSKISKQIRDSFTRYGFTTVVDTGSYIESTNFLRNMIESGKVSGPRILTAGSPIYPIDGIPFYLFDLPSRILKMLPQPRTPEEVRSIVRDNISSGADIIKLFTGSILESGAVKPMDLQIARAAVSEAHKHHRLVFGHPSNEEGIKIALNSGVDVLAHTASDGSEWKDGLIRRMLSRRVMLIPTLKLWRYEARKKSASKEWTQRFVGNCVKQLGSYYKAGGRVIFGTDSGYMTDYDPSEEYLLMSRAGMTPMSILDSLTTAPAELFGETKSRGKIAPGMKADLVLLEGDPKKDIRNFSKVVLTLRDGRVIYSADGSLIESSDAVQQ